MTDRDGRPDPDVLFERVSGRFNLFFGAAPAVGKTFGMLEAAATRRIDAAMQRHPALLLVDELTHTNAPGSRYAKRWQDLHVLLGAGIDVYSTLNVQHVESLNDVFAQAARALYRFFEMGICWPCATWHCVKRPTALTPTCAVKCAAAAWLVRGRPPIACLSASTPATGSTNWFDAVRGWLKH